jgi:2-dehydro-3-deoxygluconokinase
MKYGLNIPKTGALDFLSLGAIVHRLDPGIVPFRKANQCQIHVSGGEFNVAANLADCFGLQTGIASAMVDYPIGDLIGERVRGMGVKSFYKRFKHDGVHGPNMATRPLRSSSPVILIGSRFLGAECDGFTAGASLPRFRRQRRNSSLKR